MHFAIVDARAPGQVTDLAISENACSAHSATHCDERLRMVIEHTVGGVFGIAQHDFAIATRGRARIALARQIAMYICHVVCRQSLTDVGRIFGRDRTTVAHACGVVEDRRDEPRFDRTVELLEHVVLALMMPRQRAVAPNHAAPLRSVPVTHEPEYGVRW